MDVYQAWFNLKEGISDRDFLEALDQYMTHLKGRDAIAGWRLLRRKLGLGPPQLRQFLLMIEVRDLAQLDQAFGQVSTRAGPVEGLHHGVNSLVTDSFFALYRDFPDTGRTFGEEKF